MSQVSEPTTGDLVRDLKLCKTRKYCTDCVLMDKMQCGAKEVAADRLESQEREIERLRVENKAMEDNVWIACGAVNIEEYTPVTICGVPIADAIQIVRDHPALTARAEQAEQERDAAVTVIGVQAERLKESHVVLCNICKFEDMIGCVHKNHCDGYQLFKWRGLPQDGEGL